MKQEKPLSLALFILSAQDLSRAQNFLFEDAESIGYGLSKWCSNLNHVEYEDDTTFFTSTNNIICGR